MRRDLTLPATLASLLLVASLASGCLDGAANPIDQVVDTVTDVVGMEKDPKKAVEAAVEPVQLDETTWKIDVAATPEGGFTAVHWTLPEGALIPLPDCEETRVAWLEVLPAVGADAPKEWGFMAVRVEQDEAIMTSLAIDTPMVATWSGPLENDEHNHEVGTDPVVLPLDANHEGHGADEGDHYVLVAMAKADGPQSFEFLFRLVPETPYESEAYPAESSGDFLERMVGDAQALPEARRGTGFQLAEYVEFGSVGMGGTFTNGQVAVKEQQPAELRPLVRDVTASTSFKQAGHTLAMAGYWGNAAAGTWDIQGDLHGTTVKADGMMLGGVFMSDATGIPFAFAQTEGDGPAALDLRVQRNGLPFETLFMVQYDIGATFTQLTGVPSAEHAFAMDGGLDLPVAAAGLGGTLVGGGDAPFVLLVGQDL